MKSKLKAFFFAHIFDNVEYVSKADCLPMTSIDPDCPCTGKNMRNLAAPWILLTLFKQSGIHGYEIGKIVSSCLEDTQAGLNLAGLYRHLNLLEKRGMVVSEWAVGVKGPAKRRYFLTDTGGECLWRWIETLTNQMALIGKFFDQARSAYPTAVLPHLSTTLEPTRVEGGPPCKFPSR